jgi:hypothetical protein
VTQGTVLNVLLDKVADLLFGVGGCPYEPFDNLAVFIENESRD